MLPRRILYAQYTNPAAYPPLEHSSRILAEAGWEVLFLGTGAHGAETLCFPPHPNIREEKIAFCPPGWRQKVHFFGYCLWVLWTILSWRPQWVYFSTLHDVPLAWIASFLPGVRVIYHEHDSPLPPRNLAERVITSFRPRLFAKDSCVCIWPNLDRARSTGAQCRNPVIVWNCPRRDEVIPPRAAAVAGRINVFYHGSINPVRVPMALVSALGLLPQGVRLTIVGYETVGWFGYCDQMREEARRLGVEDRLSFPGAMPRYQSMEACRDADVGVTFMPLGTDDVNEATMIGPSNKAFDYLANGVALLMADRRDWREAFADAGMGLVCDPESAASIAKALGWFLEHPVEMRAMGERGRARILADWNYESQFAAVFKMLSA